MRNIPLATALLFIAFYWFIHLLAWLSLRFVVRNENSRLHWLANGFLGWGLLQTTGFVALFIYPFNTSDTTLYGLYFAYNSQLFADLFSKIPLAIAGIKALLFKRHRFTIAMAGLMISLSMLLIFAWGFTIGPRTLHTPHVQLAFPNLPPALDGVRIVHISDTHLGNFHCRRMFERAVAKANQFDPHLLLFTGDLVNNFAYETEGWSDYFEKFTAQNGKFAVNGNHDYGDYFRWPSTDAKKANLEAISQAYSAFGFTLLSNSSVPVAFGIDTLFVVGVENWGHPPFPQYANLDQASEGISDNNFRILLTHDPAHWESVVQHEPNYPLTLSGHSHGLQWGIKLAGIEFSLSYLTRKNWGGIYEYEGRFLNVNRGLGTIGVPLRIDMPAEVTLITLRKS